jgi:hypothetical protein
MASSTECNMVLVSMSKALSMRCKRLADGFSSSMMMVFIGCWLLVDG